MTYPTPTELIAEARRIAYLVPNSDAGRAFTGLVSALEAQLAETARLQAVIEAGIRRGGELIDNADDINYEEDNFDAGQFCAADDIRNVLISAGSSSALEAVKAHTTTEWGVHIGGRNRVRQFITERQANERIAFPLSIDLGKPHILVSRKKTVTEWVPAESKGENIV
ncbi:hypothetical protein [Plantibacter sp. YIM 135249]|uniref:hypothetical protein n=1 Tax=Plantibacter sp. YIM 135249 TaxID=3423918 RepID=UPI003D335F1F